MTGITERDLLLLLAARAPSAPYGEFMDAFRKDYPPPSDGESNEAKEACFKASIATTHARWGNLTDDCEAIEAMGSSRNWSYWESWHDECWNKYKRDEWPLVWARRIASQLDASLSEESELRHKPEVLYAAFQLASSLGGKQ